MARYAAIDVGTNSVLLLVAERSADGRFTPVVERAEITRLGRGVDKTQTLATEAIEDTVKVLEQFAAEARSLGAEQIAVSATSAARDAKNGARFREAVQQRAGLTVEIISGELEAQLSYAAVELDFAHDGRPLVVIDIGGGSTEFIYGHRGQVSFRHSFDVGSVRMTERFVTTDPPSSEQRESIAAHLRDIFARLPPLPQDARVVGVAGTVTTLFALQHAIDPYDANRVQGGALTVGELDALITRLCAVPLAERRTFKGLQPKRADVIPAGALVLREALAALKAERCTVSDRGLRWGLLAHRFGSSLTGR